MMATAVLHYINNNRFRFFHMISILILNWRVEAVEAAEIYKPPTNIFTVAKTHTSHFSSGVRARCC